MANIMRIPVAKYGAGPSTGTKATEFRYVKVDDVFLVEADSYPGTEFKLTVFDGANNDQTVLQWQVEGAKNALTEAGINRINDALLANANKPGEIIDIEELLNSEGITFNLQGQKTTRALPSSTSQP